MKEQIDEMANDYYEIMLKAAKSFGTMSQGVSKFYARHLYEKGYRKQEWISVDERLPEIEGIYLAYTTRRTIEIAHFYPYYVNGKPQFDYWITHWMPLPEAPKRI